MIPDYFAPTLELLSSGDLEQIRRGLRQAKDLNADIPGVVNALEKLFAIETSRGDSLLDDLWDSLFEFRDSMVKAGLEDKEDSGVVFESGESVPVAFEEVLRVIPLLTRHLPWMPQMQSTFALYTSRSFQYYLNHFTPNSPESPFYSNLTQHEGPITLDAITSPKAVFYDSTSIRVYLHDHVKGLESLISCLEAVVDNGDEFGVAFADSSSDSEGIEDVSKMRELLPEFRYVLGFEGHNFNVPVDNEGNYYLDDDGEEITETDHAEDYLWGILARV